MTEDEMVGWHHGLNGHDYFCLFYIPRASQVLKSPHVNAGDTGLTPGPRRYPGGDYGNPLQYSCLENSLDRGAWWAIVHGVAVYTHHIYNGPIHGHEIKLIFIDSTYLFVWEI